MNGFYVYNLVVLRLAVDKKVAHQIMTQIVLGLVILCQAHFYLSYYFQSQFFDIITKMCYTILFDVKGKYYHTHRIYSHANKQLRLLSRITAAVLHELQFRLTNRPCIKAIVKLNRTQFTHSFPVHMQSMIRLFSSKPLPV